MKRFFLVCLALGALLVLSGCSPARDDDASPALTEPDTSQPENTVTVSPSPTPGHSPEPENTPTVSPTLHPDRGPEPETYPPVHIVPGIPNTDSPRRR